jgi:hypothetical protein
MKILPILLTTVFSTDWIEQFLSNGKIPNELPPGTSSILVRLGVALSTAHADLHAHIIENFKWEVNMHEYLETANFSTVGHFHLHATINEESPIVTMIKQIAVYQPNVLIGVDEGKLCDYVESLTDFSIREANPEIQVEVYCTNNVERLPNDSLLIAVSEQPRVWHEKIVEGGVVFGVGRVDEELVKWRAWREITFAPGELFWWFREPEFFD